jgi:hypothetical protein
MTIKKLLEGHPITATDQNDELLITKPHKRIPRHRRRRGEEGRNGPGTMAHW